MIIDAVVLGRVNILMAAGPASRQKVKHRSSPIVLPLYTVINVFMGSMLSFYDNKNRKSSQQFDRLDL